MAAPPKRSAPTGAASRPAALLTPRVDAGKASYGALRRADEIRRWVGPLASRRPVNVWWPWVWFVLLGLVLASYALAVAYYHSTSMLRSFVDSLKIFPSGFPGVDTDQPWEYNFARYLAALVFLLASFRLLALAFADRLAEARAIRRRGHVVVCGLGDSGLRSVRAYRADGAKVTSLESSTGGDSTEEARALGALVLTRDATQASSLGSARVDSSNAVVCSCPDDATNTRIASLVAASIALTKRHDGPDVYVRVENPDLAQLLRGRLSVAGATVFHFFSVAGVWARAMLDDPSGPFSGTASEPPRAVVLGTNELATAVVVGAARRWYDRVRDDDASGRAEITLCGADAAATCARIVTRYPAIGRVCDVSGIEHAPEATFPSELGPRLKGSAPAAVYVCVSDAGDRLAAAFDATTFVESGTPIFVPAAAAAAILTPLARAEQIQIVDLSRAASVDLIHDQMRDRLAREAHEVWLAYRREAADFGSQSSDRPWAELPDDYRRASYSHVQDISEQLQAVWYEIEPLADWDEAPEELPESAVEAMAELEHTRWCRERRATGWRYASKRDDRRRLHPLLVPWRDLSEEKRDLDRELVRHWPAILARSGYRLTLGPARARLARLLHEQYRAEQRELGVAVPAWGELNDSPRRANLAAVDDIPVKLARIGCRAMPQTLGFDDPPSLAEPEIEQLARGEHARWSRERSSEGWTSGPRDDEAGTHPSLVPWEELDEREKEKDRRVVRAIPDLLAAAGLTIVRDSPVD
jgi:voltage-gated potassium channel Kch